MSAGGDCYYFNHIPYSGREEEIVACTFAHVNA